MLKTVIEQKIYEKENRQRHAHTFHEHFFALRQKLNVGKYPKTSLITSLGRTSEVDELFDHMKHFTT